MRALNAVIPSLTCHLAEEGETKDKEKERRKVGKAEETNCYLGGVASKWPSGLKIHFFLANLPPDRCGGGKMKGSSAVGDSSRICTRSGGGPPNSAIWRLLGAHISNIWPGVHRVHLVRCQLWRPMESARHGERTSRL